MFPEPCVPQFNIKLTDINPPCCVWVKILTLTLGTQGPGKVSKVLVKHVVSASEGRKEMGHCNNTVLNLMANLMVFCRKGVFTSSRGVGLSAELNTHLCVCVCVSASLRVLEE